MFASHIVAVDLEYRDPETILRHCKSIEKRNYPTAGKAEYDDSIPFAPQTYTHGGTMSL